MSNNQEELLRKKEYIKSAPLEDYLTEDPIISGQNFVIISYILPGETNEIEYPFFKVRGTYKTIEDCEKRINNLKSADTYFHMYICEVGKFGALYPDNTIDVLNTDIDVKYRESKLNNMVKSYKEQKDKADIRFEEHRKNLRVGLDDDTVIESQEEINVRIDYVTKQVNQLSNQLKEYEDILKLSNEKLEDLAYEEINELSIKDNVCRKDIILPHERRTQ